MVCRTLMSCGNRRCGVAMVTSCGVAVGNRGGTKTSKTSTTTSKQTLAYIILQKIEKLPFLDSADLSTNLYCVNCVHRSHLTGHYISIMCCFTCNYLASYRYLHVWL